MPQPVKLSDALVLDARLTGEIVQRSIAGQIEFWARLGRSVEDLLDGQQVRALAQSHTARPFSNLMDTMDTPEGQQRLADYLETLPFPHFEQHPGDETLLVRTDADGRRSVGRFIQRQFVLDDSATVPESEYVTPNQLAAEFGVSPKALLAWLRPRSQCAGNARYRFRKDDPILKEAAVFFRKQGEGSVPEVVPLAIGR
jgi:hypothetical protein